MPTTDPSVSRDYLVTPELGRGPGVLVLHSGRGLTPFVKQFCHRFARAGFVAYAPDLYEGATPTTADEAQTAKAAVDESRIGRQLADAGAFLSRSGETSRRDVAVVGLGYGARLACEAAPHLSETASSLTLFYGYGECDWTRVDTRVLGHFAQLDHEYPPSRMNDIRDTFASAGIEHDLFVYPGTEPSFFEADETARYDADAARLSWERTLQFLQSTA